MSKRVMLLGWRMAEDRTEVPGLSGIKETFCSTISIRARAGGHYHPGPCIKEPPAGRAEASSPEDLGGDENGVGIGEGSAGGHGGDMTLLLISLWRAWVCV